MRIPQFGLKPLFAVVMAFGLAQGGDAWATVVNDSNTGLVSPDKVIDFGSGLFSDGTMITNQFAADGVTFGGTNYGYRTISGSFPPVAGGALVANRAEQPGSILFTNPVRDAVFSWRIPAGTTTFSAWLGGVLQEQAILNTDTVSVTSGHYIGFTDIVFDEIRLSASVVLFGYSLDNLQYNVAPVPLPAPLVLLGAALAGLIGVGRVRRRAG